MAFKCDQCGEGFKSSAKFKGHRQKVHQEEEKSKGLKCELCPEEFATLAILERHVVDAHVVDKEFQCKVCKKAFIEQIELKRHAIDEHEKKVDCDSCPKCFRTIHSLRRHLQLIHYRTELCLLCLKSFPSDKELQEHTQKAKGVAAVACPDPACKLKFETPCSAGQHWSEIHKPKVESSSRTKRMEGETEFDCNFCKKSFKTDKRLRSHELRAHPNKEWKCQPCNKTFKQRCEYTRHQRNIHATERKYKCKICLKAYKTDQILKDHVKSHDTDKPYKCTKCPKSYTVPTKLRFHLANSHGEGEKPFKCPHCPLRFYLKYALEKRHLPTHFPATPFPCDACPDKLYKTKESLLQHKRLSCPANKKKYKRPSNKTVKKASKGKMGST